MPPFYQAVGKRVLELIRDKTIPLLETANNKELVDALITSATQRLKDEPPAWMVKRGKD